MKKGLSLLLALILVLTSVNMGAFTVVAEEKADAGVVENVVCVELEELSVTLPVVYSGTADYEGATEAILTGLKNWETSIDVSTYKITIDEVADFYYGIVRSNPQIFYASGGFSYGYYTGGYVTSIRPYYSDVYNEEHVAEYEARVAEILKTIPAGLSDYEKALALHDYIATHCEYDGTYSNYDAYNTLVEGVAVCQGYTLAYTDLLNRVGIENKYVVSDAMNHAWNLVKIDGAWYQVDVTWDDPFSEDSPRLGYVRHTNFLRSDVGITNTGHYSWTVDQTCTSTKYDSYFWSDITSAIIYTDADTCYYMKKGNLYKRVDDTETLISASAADKWYVWGSTSSFYSGQSFLAIKNNILYYNSATKVYAYDISTGTETVHYVYERGNGYIYGLAESEDGDSIYAEIKTSPNEGTVEIIKITPIAPAVPAFQYGDCNGDGSVNIADAVIMKQHIAGMIVDIDKVAADVNVDGVVDIKDAVKIAKKLAGMDEELGAA